LIEELPKMFFIATEVPTTGSKEADAIIALICSVLGIGATTKVALSAWFSKALKGFKDVREVVTELLALKREIADLKRSCDEQRASRDALLAENAKLRKDFDEHVETDATEAMTLMGFVEVGEEMLIVQEREGKTLLISPALCKMLGLSRDEATNGAWKDLICPEDRDRVLTDWNAFVAGNLFQTVLRFRFIKVEGSSPIPVQLKVVRKKLGTGGVVRLVGLVSREEK
jgi:PAS domain S-box-containing protein